MIRLFGRRFKDAALRLLAVAALVGFLGGVVGVPLPRLRLAKDLSRPFPCQDHSCGCANAEQCWRNCCCFTNQQKLVWAAEHAVTPPEYVVLAAFGEKPATVGRSCCQHLVKKSCDESKSCCDAARRAHDHEEGEGHEEKAVVGGSWSIEFVLAIQSRRCHGQAELWMALGAVAPPPVKVAASIELVSSDLLAVFSDSMAGISHAPAAPPPRV